MTREEHLKFCRVCANQKLDPMQGIICRLTGDKANFEVNCTDFTDINRKIKSPQNGLTGSDVVLRSVTPGIRFANFIIDKLAFFILLYIFLNILKFISTNLSLNLNHFISNFSIEIIIIAWFAYYILFEYFLNRTIGKLISGTMVVRSDGSQPTFKDILIRTISRLIPFETISFLISESSWWHDSLSNTEVIKVK